MIATLLQPKSKQSIEIDFRKYPVNSRGWRMNGIMDSDYRRQRGYARRQAVRYNDRENEDLLAQYHMGYRQEDIAEYHERTLNGVSTQINRLLEGTARGDGPARIRRMQWLPQTSAIRKYSSTARA